MTKRIDYGVDLQKLHNSNDVRIIAARYIEDQCNVLDLGCANGDFGSYLKHIKMGLSVDGIDISKDAVAFACDRNVYRNLKIVDLANPDEKILLSNDYHYICLLDVLEHLECPDELLGRIVYENKDNAKLKLIISMPNISFFGILWQLYHGEFNYESTGILDRTHRKFYGYKNIATLLSNAGLEIEKCDCVLKPPNFNSPYGKKRFIEKIILYFYILFKPHLFVYQYIFLVKNSNKSNLIEFNLNKIKLSRNFITRRLFGIVREGFEKKWRRKN